MREIRPPGSARGRRGNPPSYRDHKTICDSLFPRLSSSVNPFVGCCEPIAHEFGKHITFWGAIDTQRVLPRGTPQEVREEVKRRIDDFAPGGGFIFNTVHNIQADVPPENIMAMWEALREHGVYN